MPLTSRVWDWELGRVVGSASAVTLVEAADEAARVGVASVVTVDVRDSCGLPLLHGNDDVTVTRLEGPVERTPLSVEIRDRRDGTYEIAFTPVEPGTHTLVAAVHGAPTRALTFEVLDAFAPRCAAQVLVG